MKEEGTRQLIQLIFCQKKKKNLPVCAVIGNHKLFMQYYLVFFIKWEYLLVVSRSNVHPQVQLRNFSFAKVPIFKVRCILSFYKQPDTINSCLASIGVA